MEQIKVLLVDDEEDFVNSLSERLEIRDVKADVALNGEQALVAIVFDMPFASIHFETLRGRVVSIRVIRDPARLAALGMVPHAPP